MRLRRDVGLPVSAAPAFNDLERRILAADDRAIDRIDAQRARFAGGRWFIPRPIVRGPTCPHGVAVMSICEACPVWIGGAK